VTAAANGSSVRNAGAVVLVRALAFVLLLALLTVFVIWHNERFSPRTALIAGAVGVAPWLLAARGLWRGGRDSYLAALLLTTPYLCYGLMEVLANPGARGYAGATVGLAFALAVALVACLRVNRPTAAAPT
jgi:uncharacterized membrane protein